MFGIFKGKIKNNRVGKMTASEYKECLDRADKAAKVLIARSNERVIIHEKSK